MNNKEMCKNPHLKTEMIELLLLLVPVNHPGRAPMVDFSYIFEESQIFKKYFIESLLKLTVDAQKVMVFQHFIDKFNMRNITSKLITFVFNQTKS